MIKASEMVEKVARAICLSYGSKMVAGSTIATREFPWEPDGGHLRKYTDYYWSHWTNEAQFAIEAMRDPTAAMLGDRMTHFEHHRRDDSKAIWQAMIDAALK